MSKTKRVGFNFFNCKTKERNEFNYLDLRPILEYLRRQYQEGRDQEFAEYKRVYTYNGEPARLADISIDYDTQFYHLTFERLNYAVPNKTTLHGDSEMLDLEADEWIGLEVTVLYDPGHHILMIQRNRDSLGPTAIGAFLESLVMQAELADNFIIEMVTDPSARERAFNQSKYRKITTKIRGARANGLLERLWKRNPGVESVEITFNSRVTKDGAIDHQFTRDLLEEFVNDPEVERLRIRSREYDESPVEPIDLINHKLEASRPFDLRRERQLNTHRVFEVMVEIYLNEGYRNRILRMG